MRNQNIEFDVISTALAELPDSSMAEGSMADGSLLEEIVEPLLPSLVGDYLNTLLQSVTEFPERRLEKFTCLRFEIGGRELLTPLSRIERVERIDPTSNLPSFLKWEVGIPECDGDGDFTMILQGRDQRISIQRVLGVCEVRNENVLWRRVRDHAPWFPGTHKDFLCRIFDPIVLIDELQLVN